VLQWNAARCGGTDSPARATTFLPWPWLGARNGLPPFDADGPIALAFQRLP
jgi:hypothetical protein